jgi:hypothetical protein
LQVRPAVMKMYATMLPRLEARRALEQWNLLVAAGELRMEPNQRGGFIDDLEQRAAGVDVAPKRAPSQVALEQMGIQVKRRVVPKGGEVE